MNTPKDIRQGIANENIQEVLDAAVSDKHALQGGQNQFQTPDWLARGLAAQLPHVRYDSVLDPQCANGNLLRVVQSNFLCGSDIDKRFKAGLSEDGDIVRVTANCVSLFADFAELYPDGKFACIVANPPFGIRWKLNDGTSIDSTEWTWQLIEQRLAECGSGFLISNANTLERLKLHEHKWVYLYQRFPAGGIWEECGVELGVIHFYRHQQSFVAPSAPRIQLWDHVPSQQELSNLGQLLASTRSGSFYHPWGGGSIRHDWMQLQAIAAEEARSSTPKWNIYLDRDGMLRTYLSTRSQVTIQREEITKLARINRCHPLTLTTERETRKLMHEFLTAGVYTIQPEAKAAITDALAQVASMACPIRDVTEFEHVAYAEEEDTLKCKAVPPGSNFALTVSKRYEVRTGTYGFTQRFTRKKIHFNEQTEETTMDDHDCELSGEDRYVEITDDRMRLHRFMDRPDKTAWHHPEEMLWQIFEKPYVPTVKEVQPEQYEKNLAALKFNEMLGGFEYFPGQLGYVARLACKDYGLVAADVGTGKSPMALALIALKGPRRTLLIAPQGTMRSTGEEDEIDYEASQWVKEIQRFAPMEPVFQLFGQDDWRHILHANGGELPPGIYITYPQAYFSNGAFEHIPESWDRLEEKKFCERFNLTFSPDRAIEDCFHRNVGAANKHGIRCIAEASLATLIAAHHGEAWDMVILDEAHLVQNLDARISQNFIRLQPRFRFAMTATPIPNIVSNLFSLMGWLCVPHWHRGNMRNAAWPYSSEEIGRFNSTFLSTETDLTAQDKARAAGKRGWRRVGQRFSPIISSPARLLKLLKPTMAYISKEDCNPNLQPCEVIDVRVATGKEQSVLYKFWLNRRNYLLEYKNPLTIAQVQSSRLRGICAAPASLDYTRGMCKSNFNQKTITILELVRDCLAKGEQAVIVSARVSQSAALVSRLSQAGITLARIDSTVPAELHASEANRFKKGDARVMLMGIKCAQGHSFDQCPNLIIASLEWSYGTLHQAKGRVWRLTSPQPVKIWCVLHKNTIEELLFDRVALKQDAATLCLQGKRVPRDFKTLDVTEILAEHMINYNAADGEILSETECDTQWPELKKQLVLANRTRRSMPIIGEEAA